MRYMFALEPEDTGDKELWAAAGEPVVPQFPHLCENVWLGLITFKPAPAAVAIDHDDVNLDLYVAKLQKEYPGLPEQLLTQYVLTTGKLAYMVDTGQTLQVFINQDEAKVLVRETEEWIELWKKQPIT